MEIKICNIGVIESADITVNSITVIAGDNNTGKSTIGKCLYSLVTGLQNLKPEKLLEDKYNSIIDELARLDRVVELSDIEYENFRFRRRDLREAIISIIFEQRSNNFEDVERLCSEKVNESISEIRETIFKDYFENLLDFYEKSRLEKAFENIKIKLDLSFNDQSLKRGVIQSAFQMEFNDSINSIFESAKIGKIFLNYGKDDIDICFENELIIANSSNVEMKRALSNVIVVDDPCIINSIISRNRLLLPMFRNNRITNHKLSLEKTLAKGINDNSNNPFQEKFLKLKCDKILNDIIKGELIYNNRKLKYVPLDNRVGIDIGNLSTGLKTFTIIKTLINSGALSDCEFLILDEPEIHLHPEWQLKYAEIIVILAKELNIKILLTTHSPYFIEAIELYSKYYHFDKEIKFYKMEMNSKSEMARAIDVSENLDELYNDMAIPFRKLDDIREECNDD